VTPNPVLATIRNISSSYSNGRTRSATSPDEANNIFGYRYCITCYKRSAIENPAKIVAVMGGMNDMHVSAAGFCHTHGTLIIEAFLNKTLYFEFGKNKVDELLIKIEGGHATFM